MGIIRRPRKTIETFIKESIEVHGELYDYSLGNYITTHTKIKIKCNECNKTFEQPPADHLGGHGCRLCLRKKRSIKHKNLFLERAIQTHQDEHGNPLYEYFDDYVNNNTKIKIKCNNGHIFKQEPRTHLVSGCSKCYTEGNVLTTEEYIQKAKEMHGDNYDYSLVNYIRSEIEVSIICLKYNHGIFTICLFSPMLPPALLFILY